MNYYKVTNQFGISIIRIENGVVWWLGENENDPNYLAWVAEGNTAEEWSPEA